MIYLLSFVLKSKKNIKQFDCDSADNQENKKKIIRCPTSLIVAYRGTKYTQEHPIYVRIVQFETESRVETYKTTE